MSVRQAELATVLSLVATVAGIMVAAGLLIKHDTERSREQIGKWAAQGHGAGYSAGYDSGGDPLAESLLASEQDGMFLDGDAGALPAALAGPVVLSWSRIGFSVPAPGGGPGRRRILRGVSGVAGAVPAEGDDEPGGGCLTAIIGPSGRSCRRTEATSCAYVCAKSALCTLSEAQMAMVSMLGTDIAEDLPHGHHQTDWAGCCSAFHPLWDSMLRVDVIVQMHRARTRI